MSISVRISCLGLLVYATLQAAASSTTTTLDFSANPITRGQLETLTATVQSGAPVTPGLVTFTEGKNVLGTTQLRTDGTATLPVRFGPGVHRITANFAGTRTYGSSRSPVQELTVSGAQPTTTFAFSETPGNYTLTGTVSFDTPSVPPGVVTFVDRTNANLAIGTASLVPTGRTQTFNYTSYSAGQGLEEGAVRDLNGDGVPDLAFAGADGLTLLLGRGDGTLGYPARAGTEPSAFATAAGDFNSDGIPDLAVVGNFPGGVNILLGQGDGTFGTYAATSSGYIAALSLAVADFNADGIPDLAVGDVGSRNTDAIEAQTGQGTIVIFLGKGNGTFSNPLTLDIQSPSGALATGDFNADGYADLASVDLLSGTVTVLLGVGDGTFQPKQVYGGSEGSQSLIVADFNNDGVPDLAVANREGTVGVCLGKGDGTFQAEAKYPASNGTYFVVAADVNDDDIVDLVTSNNDEGTLSFLQGEGDGTFQSPTTYQVGTTPRFLAVSDWNSDGIPDLGVLNYDDGTLGILQGAWQATATANLHNVAIFGSGLHETVASYEGSAISAPDVSQPLTLETTPVRTTLVLSAYPDTTNQGQPIQLTAVLSPTMAYNYTAGGSVTFSTEKKTLGVRPVVNGAAVLPTADLPVGINLVIARYSGDANFSESRSASTAIKVNAVAGLARSSGFRK